MLQAESDNTLRGAERERRPEDGCPDPSEGSGLVLTHEEFQGPSFLAVSPSHKLCLKRQPQLEARASSGGKMWLSIIFLNPKES